MKTPEGEEEEWQPARISRPLGRSTSSGRGGDFDDGGNGRNNDDYRDRPSFSGTEGGGVGGNNQMFESFRNLESAMAAAKRESLQTQKDNASRAQCMAQSFRDLDLAMEIAKKESLKTHRDESINHARMEKSFRDLESVLAEAKTQSLQESGGAYAASFDDLDGAIAIAMDNSLKDISYDPDADEINRAAMAQAKVDSMKETCAEAGPKGNLAESFSQMDDAIALAMLNSMNDKGQRSPKLDALYEDYESSSEDEDLDDSLNTRMRQAENMVLTKTARRKGGQGLSGSRVEYVAEPAPDLSRLAYRQADQRLNSSRNASEVSHSFTTMGSSGGDDDAEEDEEARIQRRREQRRLRRAGLQQDGMRQQSSAGEASREGSASSQSSARTRREGPTGIDGERVRRHSSLREETTEGSDDGHSLRRRNSERGVGRERHDDRRRASNSFTIPNRRGNSIDDDAPCSPEARAHYSSPKRASIEGSGPLEVSGPKEVRKKKGKTPLTRVFGKKS